MVTEGEPRKSPSFSQRSPKLMLGNGRNAENGNSVFSPRFKSIAAMAGWDEETLLIASLTVDDTPERELKQRKRPNLTFKTPPSNSRRKRRDRRRSPAPVLATVLNLEEEEASGKVNESSKKQVLDSQHKERKTEANELPASGPAELATPSASASLTCLDKLREELSCAICLEICYEPSTTACGHSFCKKCLRSAAEKCGKRCPKCRQLISSGRSCSVNTVLWNTIQLLFPKEVESRKASSGSSSPAAADEGRESERGHGDRRTQPSDRRRIQPSTTPSSSAVRTEETQRGGRALPSQDGDAALALRLQREEFMEIVRGGGGRRRRRRDHESSGISSSFSLARENLRAIASRAINLRIRSSGRPT
ncbi:hypothetical protein SAY86_004900 [Trapa natans]|uniref:RING-type E3 ubiquitin transferase n=1 Tax=Trapa natans TaxID=22666 RepID=A0AAN7RQX7_TRANT|nr:hypothetical protein SAY86_004900 [Trapa natans]